MHFFDSSIALSNNTLISFVLNIADYIRWIIFSNWMNLFKVYTR